MTRFKVGDRIEATTLFDTPHRTTGVIVEELTIHEYGIKFDGDAHGVRYRHVSEFKLLEKAADIPDEIAAFFVA